MRVPIVAILIWLTVSHGFAETPKISQIAPLTIHPGQTNLVTLFGDHLESLKSAWLSGTNSSARVIDSKSDRASLEVWTEAENESVLGLCVGNSNKISDLQLIAIDALPLTTNRSSHLQIPCAVDATANAGVSDTYEIELHKDDRICVEIVANRIGSTLTPLVRLLSPDGKELVYGADIPSVTADSAFEYSIEKPGLYKVEVRDIGYQGGPNFFYHLRLFNHNPKSRFLSSRPRNAKFPQEQEPNNTLETASQINIPGTLLGNLLTPGDIDYFRFTVTEKQRLIFAGRTRTVGSPCDLKLTLLDGNAKKIASNQITGTNDGTLTNIFATAGTYFLKVEELAGRGGPNNYYELHTAEFQPGFELSMDLNKIDFASTNTVEVKITAQRFDYDGPITLAMIPRDPGIQLENETIPAKKRETTLKLKSLNTNENHLVAVRLEGTGGTNQNIFNATVNVAPVLHKLFPLLIQPPPNLEEAVFCLEPE